MKKYLMSAVAMLAMSAAFIACSNDENVFDPEQAVANEKARVEGNYQVVFAKAFGTPASNHTWGFGEYSGTRSVDVNSNEWEAKGYNIPKAITDRERQVVMEWFATHKNPTSQTVDLTNYFVLNVGHGDANYTSTADANGFTHDAVGSAHMDWIYCGPGRYMNEWEGMTEPAAYTWDNGDEHINNFNAYSGEIQHILYTGSEYFGFHDSFQDNGAGSKYGTINRNFVLRFIDVDGEVGCYVGFDYESHGAQGDIEPDGFFNDRVIKLIPGVGETEKKVRVICEDMTVAELDAEGNVLAKGDFDFNDAVFDLTLDANDNVTDIEIVYAGAEFGITVDGVEVHQALGLDKKQGSDFLYQMGAGTGSYKFKPSAANLKPADVAVVVTRAFQLNDGSVKTYDVTLGAVQGKAPGKILVQPRFKIVPERKAIDVQYPLFPQWVQDETVVWY